MNFELQEPRPVRRIKFAEGGDERCYRGFLGFLAEVEAAAAVPDEVVAVGRVAWEVPRRPDQAATASAPVAATKRLTRWDNHAIR